MSEVVPLPSFGEVFFDARGQERVLRVTWHEGTLVLSLWRGEMCTASFRMPFQDVERLLDTLETGFAEAGGQLSEQAEQEPGNQAQGEYPDYPGTGQYARPQQQPEQGRQGPQTGPYPQQPAAAYQEQQPAYDAAGYGAAGPYQEQGGYQEAAHYADDHTAVYSENDPYQDDGYQQDGGYQDNGSYQGGGSYPESDPRLASVPSVGPNDVLVARGKNPAPDKLVATGPATPPAQPPQQQYGRQPDQYGQHTGRPGPGQHGGPPPQGYGGGQGGRPPQRGAHGQPGGRHGQPPVDGGTDPYGMPPLEGQGGYSSPPPAVDPADPLGLGQISSPRAAGRPAPDYQPVDYQPAPDYQPADYQQGYQQPPGHYQQQPDPLAPRGYDNMYSGGEHVRPEDQPPRGDDRRREW